MEIVEFFAVSDEVGTILAVADKLSEAQEHARRLARTLQYGHTYVHNCIGPRPSVGMSISMRGRLEVHHA